MKKRFLVGLMFFLLLWGCELSTPQKPSLIPSQANDSLFENFLAANNFQKTEYGYIYDGDIAFSENEVYRLYNESLNINKGNIAVDENNTGFRYIWTRDDAMQLTYRFTSDMSTSYLTDTQVRNAFRQAAAAWSALPGVMITEVDATVGPRFCVYTYDGGLNSNIGYTFFPQYYLHNGYEIKINSQCLNSCFTTYNGMVRVFTHFLGHSLGLENEELRQDNPIYYDHDEYEGVGDFFSYYDEHSIMNDDTNPMTMAISDGDRACINFLYNSMTCNFISENGIIGHNLQNNRDRILKLDYNGDNYDDLIIVSPGARHVYIGRSNGNGTFTKVYGTSGIIGYDMNDIRDKIKILNINNDGLDDIMCYRPGSGQVYIGRSNGDGTFTQVYANYGIIGFDMGREEDQVRILDFNNDGLDDIICYRPGSGQVYIGRSNGDGTFTKVYSEHGIIGFDMGHIEDQVRILDFNNDGLDDIICYRPGSGQVFVGRSNGDGTFTKVYAAQGIIGFDMKGGRDQMLVLNLNNDELDDIMCYRPGSGQVYIGRSNGDGTFTKVYSAHGIIGYDMNDIIDRVQILDINNDNLDDIICYRPDSGKGQVYIGHSNGDGTFTQDFSSHSGVPGLSMQCDRDKILILDYNNDGKDDILAYRPGNGIVSLQTLK